MLIEKSKLIEIQQSQQFQLENLQEYQNILIHYINISKTVQKELLKINPTFILYFKEKDDKIKKFALEYCDELYISNIYKCIYFNIELYNLYIKKCQEFNVDIIDMEKSNKEFEDTINKRYIMEYNSDIDELFKYLYNIPINKEIENIQLNPLSLIRIFAPSYEMCKTCIEYCESINHLNRIMYNIDIWKYKDLYNNYINKYNKIKNKEN
jgi:hypothetical protein